MALDVTDLAIDGVKLVKPRRFEDARGFFSETYNQKQFHDAGVTSDFIQDNHSFSAPAFTVRGLHYQAPPFAQTKLVRVLRGSILDVAVDVRSGSPTYGEWVSAELSASNGVQILVPRGFLHGFVTLEDNTEVAYKVDSYYSGEADGSVFWNDPDLAIDWNVDPAKCVLSDKDANALSFREFKTPF